MPQVIVKKRKWKEAIEGLELSRELAKQVLSQLSYTPTVATTFNSKAFGPVREPRNATICSLAFIPRIEERSANENFRREIGASAGYRKVQTVRREVRAKLKTIAGQLRSIENFEMVQRSGLHSSPR